MDALDLSIHAAAHGYGLPKLARKLGKSEQVFRNRLNPNDEANGLRLAEFVAILDVTGNMTPLEILAGMFGHTISHRPKTYTGSLLSAILAADAEYGDIARTIRDAISDGRLNTRERLAIRKEISEARLALDALEDRVMSAREDGV
jgi:hypothetical protein